MSNTPELYEFGPFRLDVANARLLRDGEPVALPPKTFEVLTLLVGRAGNLVEKDALMLGRTEHERLARHYTPQADAFTAYLRGRSLWATRSGADLERAVAAASAIGPGQSPGCGRWWPTAAASFRTWR